jgi:peptide/nickel transport system permease protein
MGGVRGATLKLGQLLFVLWAVATVLFFIFRLMPGDPTAAFIEPTFTQAERDELRRQFGLDQPIFQQYLLYLLNLVQLNLGKSFFYREDVAKLVWQVFPNTIVLTLAALAAAYLVGIVLGATLAWKRNSTLEKITLPVVLVLRAAPEFWLGMVLLAVFSFSLGWLPSGGTLEAGSERGSVIANLFSRDFLAHLFLPAVTLALYLVGLPVLLMRSTMLEVLNEDFVTLARMQGFAERTIMLRHAARNALLPVATAFTLGIGYSVGGNVVIETVFSWPGLGRLLVKAVQAHDYPLAQGAFMLIAVVTIAMNGFAELLYRRLDPRVDHVG